MLFAAAISASASLMAAGIPAVADEGFVRVHAAAEACVTQNAAKVESSDSSLRDAVQFLVADLCVQEIALVVSYKANLDLLNVLKRSSTRYQYDSSSSRLENARAREAFAKRRKAIEEAYIDSMTGEIKMDEAAAEAPFQEGGLHEVVVTASRTEISPPNDIRALAARAILNARAARLGSQPSK
jgi:hypothetical protein